MSVSVCDTVAIAVCASQPGLVTVIHNDRQGCLSIKASRLHGVDVACSPSLPSQLAAVAWMLLLCCLDCRDFPGEAVSGK